MMGQIKSLVIDFWRLVVGASRFFEEVGILDVSLISSIKSCCDGICELMKTVSYSNRLVPHRELGKYRPSKKR